MKNQMADMVKNHRILETLNIIEYDMKLNIIQK